MSMFVEPCCVPVTVLRDLHVLTHLLVTTILWGRFLLSLLFFIATSWHVFYSVKFVFFFPFDSIFNWSITDLQCCANLSCSASATYIQTFFFIFFSIMVCHVIEYSSLCYTLGPCCLSNSKCNSLHLPTPSSQSIPLPSHPLGSPKSVLCVCESVSGTAWWSSLPKVPNPVCS